jgi:hypothetical protein
MTGIAWLDVPAAVAFAVVAVVSLARSLAGVLPARAFVVVVDGVPVVPAGRAGRLTGARTGGSDGARGAAGRAEAAAHAVMAAGMAAMSWPGGPTLGGGGAVAWAAACAVAGVGAVAVLARRRPADRAGARAAHLVLAALVMVVALAAGHGAGAHGAAAHGAAAHGANPGSSGHDGGAGAAATDDGPGPAVATATATATATEDDLGALGDAGRRAAAWSVWPLAGVAFAAEGLGRGRALARRGRSADAPDPSTGGDRWWGRCLTGDRPDHVCAVVMAAGMAVMAFGL